MAVTIAEQVASVIREIGMRERVYPNWVEKRRMSQQTAEKELAAMKAVLETVRRFERGATTHAAIDLVAGMLEGHSEDALAGKLRDCKDIIADVPLSPPVVIT